MNNNYRIPDLIRDYHHFITDPSKGLSVEDLRENLFKSIENSRPQSVYNTVIEIRKVVLYLYNEGFISAAELNNSLERSIFRQAEYDKLSLIKKSSDKNYICPTDMVNPKNIPYAYRKNRLDVKDLEGINFLHGYNLERYLKEYYDPQYVTSLSKLLLGKGKHF